jgi:murein DD-endopeptidase MepM/ murein hydrolase activator NlpD
MTLARFATAGWVGLVVVLAFGGTGAAKKKKRRKAAATRLVRANVAIEAFRGTGTIFARVLNIRTGPGTQYRDVGNVYRGQRVALTARTKGAVGVPGYSGAYRWYRVKVGGIAGWSWGGFITIGQSAPPQRQPGGGQPAQAPGQSAGKAIEAFDNVGTVFARGLRVRAEPSLGARILTNLAYGKVARLTARTKYQYAVAGYRGSYRWYRVQVGGIVGWSWGGFISVGKKTPPERGPGGGKPCDTRRANCHPHRPPGGGPTTPGPVVPSAGPALSVFPIVGKHWSWQHKGCNYNDYYHGTGVNHPNGHIGNDIFAPRGAPLVAVVSGTVVRAGWGGSVGGNRVTIRRGNWYFYYAHMTTVSVRAGQSVKAGQRIGTLGNTGSASGTEPHVHFSIYPGDNYSAGINPYPHLMKVDRQCK